MIHEERINIERERESLTSTNNIFYYKRKPQKPEEWDLIYKLTSGVIDLSYRVQSGSSTGYLEFYPWKVFNLTRYENKNNLANYSKSFWVSTLNQYEWTKETCEIINYLEQ